MIIEHAFLQIDPNNATEFEAAVKQAQPCFEELEYCHSMKLARVMETPGKYVLQVQWTSLEAHIVDFRESENFQIWRGLVGKFFTEPPHVEHVEMTVYF